MKDKRQENITREEILDMLSDEEVSMESVAEEPRQLIEGDEFIDLEHLDKGIQEVHFNTKVNPSKVIVRSAIRDVTWDKIIKRL